MAQCAVAGFMAEAAEATQVLHLETALGSLSEAMGFGAAGYFQLSVLNTPSHPRSIFGDPMSDWVEVYRERQYGRVDPVIQLAYQTDTPFTSREVARRFPEADDLHVERSDLWAPDAAFCPVRSSFGETGLLVLTADAEIVLTRLARIELAACAAVAVETYKTLTEPQPETVEDLRPLSRREMECVFWLSQGKSMDEVAIILNISASTVRQYIASSTQKLNANNRIELIFRAFHLGLISAIAERR